MVYEASDPYTCTPLVPETQSFMTSRLRLTSSTLAAAASLLLLSVAPSATLAGPDPVPAAPPAAAEPNKFLQSSVAIYGTNYFNSDFDGLNTGFGVSRYSFYGEFKFKLSPIFRLKLFTYADYSLYSFKNLPPPSPQFSNLLRGAAFERVDLTLAYTFTPGWAVVVGGRVTSGTSTNGDFANSFTGGGILGIKKSIFSGAVDVTVGASYTSRLARPAQLLPYFDVDVNVLPEFVKIPVNLLFKWGGGIVSYRVTDNLSLMVEGRIDSRFYRLNRNSAVLANGVWYESSGDIGGGFGYSPRGRNWTLSVLGGYSVFRNVQVYNTAGQKLFDNDVKPAPYINANFHAAF